MAGELEFRAMHKYARITPRKTRYVMDLIRGKPVAEALLLLQFSNRRAARFVDKVLRSALANAGEESTKRKLNLDAEKLYIKEGRVDAAPMFKRFRARSRGIANRILKRNSHIIIGLAPLTDELREKMSGKKKRRTTAKPKGDAGKPAAAPATNAAATATATAAATPAAAATKK